MLQCSFGVDNEGSVVIEVKVMEQQLKYFCVDMQSPEVKQTAVKTVADVNSTVIVKVFCDLFKHHGEKDPEQSRWQNTTLFHAVDDWEGSREVAVQPNLAALVFVQLDNHSEELWGSQGAPWSYTVPFCSLCQMLWLSPLTQHTVLCFAPCISPGAVWRRTPGLRCPCWLWTHTGFLVDGLQRWWVPIYLGVHEQGFFLWWRAEWFPDSWSNLTFLPCFCTRWQWLHRWSLGSLSYYQQQTSSWSLLCNNAGPPSFQNSDGIPSTPVALPLLNYSMALVIYFIYGS